MRYQVQYIGNSVKIIARAQHAHIKNLEVIDVIHIQFTSMQNSIDPHHIEFTSMQNLHVNLHI